MNNDTMRHTLHTLPFGTLPTREHGYHDHVELAWALAQIARTANVVNATEYDREGRPMVLSIIRSINGGTVAMVGESAHYDAAEPLEQRTALECYLASGEDGRGEVVHQETYLHHAEEPKGKTFKALANRWTPVPERFSSVTCPKCAELRVELRESERA